jgi:hypothetical protein
MTKKTPAPEAVEEAPDSEYMRGRLDESERIDTDARFTAMEFALTHHKINGGMLTVGQLIENARQFHAYIKGENK